VGRTIERTCQVMKENGIDDPYDTGRIRDLGVIDLPLIQKKLNLHYTLSLDLFGQEVSTNAANAFNAGIKGRYMENRLTDDHQLQQDTYTVWDFEDGKAVQKQVAALTAINMRLRDDYTKDAAGGVGRWNKIIEKHGVDFQLSLPHEAFHRKIGVFADKHFDPSGQPVSGAEYDAGLPKWLPTHADGDFIQSLMKPCYEPGQYARWIAPPKVGIDNRPGDFEYVKLHMA
jgi:benzoyl-CoA 2,3-dioxygenase component B